MQKKLILVLGGSTFMGKSLLAKLKDDQQFQTIYINRGKKYWNDEVKTFMNLNYFYGNRKQNQDFTKLLKYLNKRYNISEQRKWTAIIDFSAFKYPDIQSVKQAMWGLTELYIFISTDSIYDIYFKKYSSKPRPEMESFAILTEQQKAYAKRKQEYGYNKLKCQMYLKKTLNIQQFPYISLILPDVIGPYDDTGRFWAYLKWIQTCSNKPVLIDEDAKIKKMSLVFSQDVSKFIYKCVKNGKYLNNQDVLCKSYNLAFNQNFTLLGMLQIISNHLKTQIKLKQTDSAPSFYPSVDFGILDTSLAKKNLGWQPTPVKIAIAETIQFFMTKGTEFKDEERQAQQKLKKKIYS